jgi:hypothetical protein
VVGALLAQAFLTHELVVALQDRSLLIGLVAVQQHLQLLSSWLSLEAVAVEVRSTQTVLVAVAALVDSVLLLLAQQAVVVLQRSQSWLLHQVPP